MKTEMDGWVSRSGNGNLWLFEKKPEFHKGSKPEYSFHHRPRVDERLKINPDLLPKIKPGELLKVKIIIEGQPSD